MGKNCKQLSVEVKCERTDVESEREKNSHRSGSYHVGQGSALSLMNNSGSIFAFKNGTRL